MLFGYVSLFDEVSNFGDEGTKIDNVSTMQNQVHSLFAGISADKGDGSRGRIAAATRLFDKFCLPSYCKQVGWYDKDRWLDTPQHGTAIQMLERSSACPNTLNNLQSIDMINLDCEGLLDVVNPGGGLEAVWLWCWYAGPWWRHP